MHSRNVWLTACSALALATGCGGGGGAETQEAAPGPRIEKAVAERLAARSDQIAERLESGDSCGAAGDAARLRDDLTLVINGKQIPEPYLEDLSGAVNEIVASIPSCSESTSPSDDDGKKKKKKDKKRDEDPKEEEDD